MDALSVRFLAERSAGGPRGGCGGVAKCGTSCLRILWHPRSQRSSEAPHRQTTITLQDTNVWRRCRLGELFGWKTPSKWHVEKPRLAECLVILEMLY